MKYKTGSSSIWWTWLLALLSVACDGDTGAMTEKAQIIFRMELPPALEVSTRVTTPPSLGGISTENVWVVQYNANNNNFIKAVAFTGEGTLDLNGNVLKINTAGAEFSQVISRFYVIVNAGTGFLDGFTGTEDELKAKTVSVSGITGELKLLTAGPIDYTPTSDGKVVVVAALNRAYAKISVKWQDTDDRGNFTISAMEVHNLPQKMALYTRGGGALNSNYPAGTDINTDTPSATGSMNSGTFYDFYMPENLRGMGTASSFADKGLKRYGPNGSLNYCTYIVLKGTYTYQKYLSDGTTPSGSAAPIDVEYHIYLGTNLIKDYNVQRGYWYQLTLNLSGANTGDVRVRITDGKTAVFDKVEEIKHTIKFE